MPVGGDQSGVGDCDSSESTSSRTTAAGPACHCVPKWYVLHRSSIALFGKGISTQSCTIQSTRIFFIEINEERDKERERELINFMF